MYFDNDTDTDKIDPIDLQTNSTSQPGMLLAHSASAEQHNDRYPLRLPVVVGRRAQVSNLQICDHTLSQKHFQIRIENGRYFLDDLNSTNGTFINGVRVNCSSYLTNGDLIRAGESLFIFVAQIQPFLSPPEKYYGLKGKFYSSVFLEQLRDAVDQNRSVLLAGPTGAGKELAAGAFAQIKNKPMLTYNAASFSSMEEAVTTLVGVESNVFSGVNSRQGLIEQAKDGILFLDEIHNYPQRVQRVLLRILEDGTYTRTGGNRSMKSEASYIFASNAAGPTYMLAEDFLARLRVVPLPDLSQRRADIPELFQFFLSAELKKRGIQPQAVLPLFRAAHYERLCLEDFRADNMRGLIDLSLRIAGFVNKGKSPEWSFLQALSDRSELRISAPAENAMHQRNETLASDENTAIRRIDTIPSPPDTSVKPTTRGSRQAGKCLAEGEGQLSPYKDQIWDVYLKNGGNLSAVCRALKLMGIETSDKTLKKYIKHWQFPSKRQMKGRS